MFDPFGGNFSDIYRQRPISGPTAEKSAIDYQLVGDTIARQTKLRSAESRIEALQKAREWQKKQMGKQQGGAGGSGGGSGIGSLVGGIGGTIIGGPIGGAIGGGIGGLIDKIF